MKTLIATTVVAALLGGAALAQSITITDGFARANGPNAKAGAAFMVIANSGDTDDRLIAAQSDKARMVELHTHLIDANGVARMREIEGGIIIPAGGAHALERGADHVMLMGITTPFADGEILTLTLEFETAGPVVVEMPVTLGR